MDEALLNWLPPELEGVEPFAGETLVADGWRYRDFNGMPASQWRQLKEAIGAEHHRLLSEATYRLNGTVMKRGQLFVSPIGLERLARRARAKAH